MCPHILNTLALTHPQARDWDGPLQYTDVATETLLMLPSDIALTTDPKFRELVQLYAGDRAAFFADFASAYALVLELGHERDGEQ